MFSFTDIFSVWLGVGEKACHQTVCMSLWSGRLCVVFLLRSGAESLFMSLPFTLATAVCLELRLLSEMSVPTTSASRSKPFMNWTWWRWVLLFLSGVDCCTICESCLRFTNNWYLLWSNIWVFERNLVRTSASPADLNPYTNIRYFYCMSEIDEILNRTQSLLTVTAYIMKSIISHFGMFNR